MLFSPRLRRAYLSVVSSFLVLGLLSGLRLPEAAAQKVADSGPQWHSLALQFDGEQPRPLAMVSGDFDGDGIQDLVVGYARGTGGVATMLRGNPEAIAPRTEAGWLAAGRHEVTAPFLQGKSVSLASQPSLMVAADVNGDGLLDLVYATAGSNTLEVLLGLGNGSFQPKPSSVAIPGTITALAAYRPGVPYPGESLLVGYETAKGARLSILSYGQAGLKTNTTYSLPGAATQFAVANLDADFVPDTAIVAGGKLLVLHGLNAIHGTGQLQTLPFSGIESVVAGQFLFDRHAQTQLSVANTSGEVLILAHEGFDPRPYTPAEIAAARQAQQLHPGSPTMAAQAGNNGGAPWVEVESEPEATGGGGEPLVLLRSRWSGSGTDDLLVLDPNRQTQTVIRHLAGTQSLAAAHQPELAGGLVGQRRVSFNRIGAGKLAGAISLRLNTDSRSGLVTLFSGKPSPEFAVPSAGNTFYVTTTADNGGNSIDPDDGTRCSQGSREVCTLRDAIAFVNNDAADNISSGKSDTIMVPAGTYPLTWQAGIFDANANAVTHLEVLGPVSIVGAGANSTIIDGKKNDVVFTINPGPFGSVNPSGNSYVFDMAISNLTIQNGQNNDNPVNSETGLFNNVGAGINWDADGTGNLTLTNVNVLNNANFWGSGGGIWIENSAGGGTGTLTLSGGSVSNNSSSENGGGLYVATPPAAVSATNTVFNANVANPNVNSSDPGDYGDAGGLYFTERAASPATPQSVLNGVSVTGNSAVQEAGGLEVYSGILLENSLVSGNSSNTEGGGFYTEIASPEVAPTVTSTNIVNNSAGSSGGGLYVGPDNPSSGVSLVLSLSRIFGNTASSGTDGLATASPGKATATENWWGCNGGPGSSGCQSAGGGATTSPWAQFLFSATTPTSIVLGGNINYALTLDTDSNGNAIPGAFPAVGGESYSFELLGPLGAAPSNGSFNSSGVGSVTQTYNSPGSGRIMATFDNQTDAINLTVSQIAASLTLASAGYAYGQPGTFTVTLNPTNATGISTSDFSVKVDGAASLDSSAFGVTLLGGTEYQITGPLNLVGPGSHTLTVAFSGPEQYTTASSSVGFTVSSGVASVSDLFSPAKPVQGVGGSVSVTVIPAGTGATPTGQVSYAFDGGTLGTVTLSAGAGTISVPATLASGSHSLALTYNGDSNYATAGKTVPFTVLGHSQTTFASLSANSATVNVFGFGFTAPSGQLAFTDTTSGNPVSSPVTLNVSTATTAFTAEATTGTGANSLPDWTTLGDVNGDGILDLITSVYGTDSVNVQLGNGDGTFGAATPILIATGFGPAENHLLSLRGNGTLDLIVGSFNTNQFAVLLGNGDGTFQTPTLYTSGSAASTPTSLTAFKFAPDSALGVAVANAGDGTVSIFGGNHSGALFLSSEPIPVGREPEAIRSGDFNGDGYLDLAVANYKDGTVTILLNRQNATLSASTISSGSGAHSGPQALAVSGSGSGLLLAVANYNDGTVSVIPSNGDGTFGAGSNFATGKGPDDVNFADFNGDGVPDLIVANYGGASVSLLLGKSGGGYAAQTQFPIGKNPYSATVGDLDGDGTPDLAVSNCLSNNIGILLGGTQISVPYPTLSLTAGHSLSAAYTPDGASQYAPSTSASTIAP